MISHLIPNANFVSDYKLNLILSQCKHVYIISESRNVISTKYTYEVYALIQTFNIIKYILLVHI